MDKTLNQVLTELGYTTGPAPGVGKKKIFLDGVEVFQGASGQVWDWVRSPERLVEVVKVLGVQFRGVKHSSAIFSPCDRYRYELYREWDATKGFLTFIGLNPSTATEDVLDPTVTRCIGYAKSWGFGALRMLNIFAYRATDPKNMKAQDAPVGTFNDWILEKSLFGASRIVCGWGNDGGHLDRSEAVLRLIGHFDLMCLKLTKSGEPWHPLYLKRDLQPMPMTDRRRMEHGSGEE